MEKTNQEVFSVISAISLFPLSLNQQFIGTVYVQNISQMKEKRENKLLLLVPKKYAMTGCRLKTCELLKSSIPATDFLFSSHKAMQLLREFLFLINLKEYDMLHDLLKYIYGKMQVSNF